MKKEQIVLSIYRLDTTRTGTVRIEPPDDTGGWEHGNPLIHEDVLKLLWNKTVNEKPPPTKPPGSGRPMEERTPETFDEMSKSVARSWGYHVGLLLWNAFGVLLLITMAYCVMRLFGMIR